MLKPNMRRAPVCGAIRGPGVPSGAVPGKRGHGAKQVEKGARGMPGLHGARKDVPSCENPRGPARGIDPRVSEWGNPSREGYPGASREANPPN